VQKLIILRGAPASGKTTIAKRLRNFEKKRAWLKVDNFKDFFTEDASRALNYVNGAAVATLNYLLQNSFSVVMDGVFQDTKPIDESCRVADKLNIPNKVFELEATLETLISRDLEREGASEGLRQALGKDTISQIYKTLKSTPYPDSTKLNTEANNLEECVKIIESP
jgi:predicted kinase